MKDQALLELMRYCEIDLSFKNVFEELEGEWSEDEMPLTVLTSRYAQVLTKNWNRFDDSKKLLVFDLTEDLMNHQHGRAKGAVALGFLEHLVNGTSSGVISYLELGKYLGPSSKKYCDAYERFSNRGKERS